MLGTGACREDMPTIAVRGDQGPLHRGKEESKKYDLFVPAKDSGRAERSGFRGCPKTTVPIES